ncbi:MAG: phosphonoacetaldehyde hydrolase [Coriobacteriia bacterium]|nr:phosphonoacetaldehyde hydrolase [Coriobacteriia bacterium]
MTKERVVAVRPVPEKISGIILDWAGTTVDYGCFAPVNAFQQIFIQRGIHPTDEEVRAPMGQAKRDHICIMLEGERLSGLWREKFGRDWTQEDVDEMYAIYEDILFASLRDFCEVKPGVLEVVEYLRRRNIKIGSTTGYTPEMMKVVAAEAKVAGYAPDAYVTPEDVGYGRPYPYMLFENMRKLELLTVAEIIKVGDTLSDIAECKNAGVYAIGVVEGSSEMALRQEEFEALSSEKQDNLRKTITKRYLDAGADAVIIEMRDLVALIG